MLPKDKKLLRLVSAKLDMSYSLEAYEILKSLSANDPCFYHVAVSMAVSYGRPFTENNGVGSLLAEYPNFPDFEDPDMNLRHHRLIDLRNKFMAHSSCEGTKVLIFPPGVAHPFSGETTSSHGHVVGKRAFGDIRFYDWLKDVVAELRKRLSADCKKRAAQIGAHLTSPEEMETGYDGFRWSAKV